MFGNTVRQIKLRLLQVTLRLEAKMPALSNPKHELFAQEAAKGTPLEKAYAVAGYKPDRKNAQRLTTKDDVRSRIDEILTQAAVKAGVSVERIVDELRDVAFADEG